ncbi:hypothetical protein GYMLUDRAFT_99387 [Collybiopsis luxurians FD-317 M1]|uniref:Uncharacterized protein n=1 Tax=Collybiopsis luxurians FD-317 M1 TaxID=944289 RepID=A0A0D0C0V6_9AGAR|nr:hypothetical protein GYMLUDRAFT_99387 [Collybiopsis luxurians FD-317 M1]
MPMRDPVTASDIDTATRATIAALNSLDINCCLVGSVACFAYGMSRTPNDIDMVALTSSYTQEDLKRRIVSYDPRFYLIASKDPYATYRVLWFRLYGIRRACKVDILLPGIMNIPSVSPQRIYRIKNHPSWNVSGHRSYYSSLTVDYPLMPFLPLLLLKLQAWQDHGESSKAHMRLKQPTDVQDIRELLELVEQKLSKSTGSSVAGNVRASKNSIHSAKNVAHTSRSLLEKEIPYLAESFVRDARVRVKKFAEQYPWSVKQWRLLGFEVNSVTKGARNDLVELSSLMRSLVLDH